MTKVVIARAAGMLSKSHEARIRTYVKKLASPQSPDKIHLYVSLTELFENSGVDYLGTGNPHQVC